MESICSRLFILFIILHSSLVKNAFELTRRADTNLESNVLE